MNLAVHLSLFVVLIVGTQSAPASKESALAAQNHGNPEVSSLTALKPRSKRWHLDPVSVTKIAKKPHSVSEVKESHSVFTNLNGNRHGFKQDHQQVSQNGKLVSKILHQQRQDAGKEGKPHMEELTEVDIPQLNIHEKIVNNDGIESEVKSKRNAAQPSLSANSAAQLAGYVLETGDQASVVQFLERMIQEGKMSEEEALVYVETIKSYLEEAEKMAEPSEDEEEKIREILLERKLEESAMQQKLEEEEEAKAEFMRSLINAERSENESILEINQFLETGLKEGKISRSTYNHLKKGLIESVVEAMDHGGNSVDYAQY
jgi:polyhydroxyalkanoate synthesis regulator phasin